MISAGNVVDVQMAVDNGGTIGDFPSLGRGIGSLAWLGMGFQGHGRDDEIDLCRYWAESGYSRGGLRIGVLVGVARLRGRCCAVGVQSRLDGVMTGNRVVALDGSPMLLAREWP